MESWSLPAKVLPSHLSTSIGALRQYLLNPPSLEADPKQLIQKKRKRRPRLARGGSDDEDDDGGLPRQQKQRKKKVAEVQNYKSAAFIDDSDDEDEEADKAFFEKERQLRERMMRVAEEQADKMVREVQARKKCKGKDKAPAAEGGIGSQVRDGDDAENEDEEDERGSDSDSGDDSDSEDEESGGKDRPQRKRRRSSQPLADESDQQEGSAAPLSEEMIASDSD